MTYALVQVAVLLICVAIAGFIGFKDGLRVARRARVRAMRPDLYQMDPHRYRRSA